MATQNWATLNGVMFSKRMAFTLAEISATKLRCGLPLNIVEVAAMIQLIKFKYSSFPFSQNARMAYY